MSDGWMQARALVVPHAASQQAEATRGQSIRQARAHGVGAGNGVNADAVRPRGDRIPLCRSTRVHLIYRLASKTLPMRKPPTGEPYAGKPPVRFGGRGGASLPDPYQGRSAALPGASWTGAGGLAIGTPLAPGRFASSASAASRAPVRVISSDGRAADS